MKEEEQQSWGRRGERGGRGKGKREERRGASRKRGGRRKGETKLKRHKMKTVYLPGRR